MNTSTTTPQYIVLKELAGNPPPELGTLQTMIYPHAGTIMGGWILLWTLVAWYMLTKLISLVYRTYGPRAK